MVLPSQVREFRAAMSENGITSLQPPTTPQVMAWPKEQCKLSNSLQEWLSKFLFTYRIAPHMTTDIAPAQLLMNLQLRSPLIVCFQIYNTSRRSKPNRQLPTTILSCYGTQDLVYTEGFSVTPLIWIPVTVAKVTGPLLYHIWAVGSLMFGRRVYPISSLWLLERMCVSDVKISVSEDEKKASCRIFYNLSGTGVCWLQSGSLKKLLKLPVGVIPYLPLPTLRSTLQSKFSFLTFLARWALSTTKYPWRYKSLAFVMVHNLITSITSLVRGRPMVPTAQRHMALIQGFLCFTTIFNCMATKFILVVFMRIIVSVKTKKNLFWPILCGAQWWAWMTR